MTQPGKWWAGWVLAAFLPVLAACSGSSGGSNSADTEASPASSATLAPPRVQPAGGVAPLLIDDATDLDASLAAAVAQHLGVNVSAVKVVSIEHMVWPNGCLGLETADRVCSQALVEGWLAVVRGPDGKEHRYRGTDTYFLPE